ncbi:hypothetical protein GCM10023331_37890 [Algivirga pacifica]|uniref:Uncharacterized protein n=1 Tax=Algivirga pacifica TaxID=1162670 RepID=A0ABP9DS13_9BACT
MIAIFYFSQCYYESKHLIKIKYQTEIKSQNDKTKIPLYKNSLPELKKILQNKLS